MANTATNVSVGKPNINGSIFRAPLGTALPTAVGTTLNAAFVGLGYVSTEGVTNSSTIEANPIKAWGGDTVYTAQTGKTDEFKFKLIESLNADVIKAVHGDANVTGTLATGITVAINASEQAEKAWVIDMVMRGNVAKRITIPNGKVTAVGDVVYVDIDAVAYDITISCAPDATGNTHYEYIKTMTSGSN